MGRTTAPGDSTMQRSRADTEAQTRFKLFLKNFSKRFHQHETVICYVTF